MTFAECYLAIGALVPGVYRLSVEGWHDGGGREARVGWAVWVEAARSHFDERTPELLVERVRAFLACGSPRATAVEGVVI